MGYKLPEWASTSRTLNPLKGFWQSSHSEPILKNILRTSLVWTGYKVTHSHIHAWYIDIDICTLKKKTTAEGLQRENCIYHSYWETASQNAYVYEMTDSRLSPAHQKEAGEYEPLISSRSGEGDQEGCCTRAFSRAFPSGYRRELKATLHIAWALVGAVRIWYITMAKWRRLRLSWCAIRKYSCHIVSMIMSDDRGSVVVNHHDFTMSVNLHF